MPYSRIRRGERGYVLLTLLLILALMAIAAGAIASSIAFDIKRDREQEMIHRGVQYSRAIRAYYKKFNRYPMKIEDLENTNQMRFLRKRYKDPLTGKDFKLLHFGEVKMSMGGGMIPGASAIGANGALTVNGPLGQNQAFGQGLNAQGLNATINGVVGQAVAANMATAQAGAQNGAAGNGQQTGSQDSSQTSSGATDANSGATGNLNGNSGDKASSTTFGGAPIVGVASTSKERTIREFDKKKKYDEWQFVYDPTLDRGFLITTPYQPQLQMFGAGPQNVNGPGGAAQPGQNNGFGNSFGSGFGNQPSPMQNNPTSPAPGGYGNQSPQPNNPPQQQ